MPLTLTSPAFAPNGDLPEKYTCRGAGLLPPLAWSDAPEQAASFALILEDPDAPGGMFRHFGAYGIPATLRELPEGTGDLAEPLQPVLHDFGAVGLFPPCPPPGSGVHRYHFRLFALASKPSFERPPTCQGLIAMMQESLLSEAVLVARCSG
jgi:Raf kinase inhibitor-like YbhB/YbcL family protein